MVIGLAEDNSFLKDCEDILPEIFIVSSVILKSSSKSYIEVFKANGAKCPRCWNYSDKIGASRTYLELCPKCVNALSR